ncbi:MAG: polysaccharide deacetylase family protein [Vicinamibacterales bacterium]
MSGAPATTGKLAVVAYHYVRDLPRSRFPRLKGLPVDVFRRQLDAFQERFEIIGLDAALDYLAGRYRPARELCLLTFDDGLREHYTTVLPLLCERGLTACFFPATSCLEGDLAPVHMIHFLMAACELSDLQRSLRAVLPAEQRAPATAEDVARAYPWDTADAGRFKYTLNFQLTPAARDQAVSRLFAEHLGDSRAFASDLYLSWAHLVEMQAQGMVVGGHSHLHRALSTMTADELRADLERSTALLRRRLGAQQYWPFAYPYGWHDEVTVAMVRDFDYTCAFTVESGANAPGADAHRLRRFDTVQLLPA